MAKQFTWDEVRHAAKYLKYKGDLRTLRHGMRVETEHRDIAHGNPVKCARIAIAHIKESDQYYKALEKMEKKLGI